MPIGLDIKRIPQKNLVINGYQIPAGVITSVKDNVMLFLKIGFVKSVLCTCCFVWLFREQIFRFKCLLRCEIWFILQCSENLSLNFFIMDKCINYYSWNLNSNNLMTLLFFF